MKPYISDKLAKSAFWLIMAGCVCIMALAIAGFQL